MTDVTDGANMTTEGAGEPGAASETERLQQGALCSSILPVPHVRDARFRHSKPQGEPT